VEVEVTDNGVGIRERDRENVFKPFFSTKPNGIGIGLSIVQRIVEQHNGEIRVSSTPGEGTTFSVLLPGGDNA
jgi:signal transduction histidine kinase